MAVGNVSSVSPAFPQIVRELGVSRQRVGWLVTAYSLPGVALAPVFGVAQGLSLPAIQTRLTELAPIEHRAMLLALNGSFIRLGQALGPALMGLVIAFGGVHAVFVVGAGLAAGMLGLTVLLIR